MNVYPQGVRGVGVIVRGYGPVDILAFRAAWSPAAGELPMPGQSPTSLIMRRLGVILFKGIEAGRAALQLPSGQKPQLGSLQPLLLVSP